MKNNAPSAQACAGSVSLLVNDLNRFDNMLDQQNACGDMDKVSGITKPRRAGAWRYKEGAQPYEGSRLVIVQGAKEVAVY